MGFYVVCLRLGVWVRWFVDGCVGSNGVVLDTVLGFVSVSCVLFLLGCFAIVLMLMPLCVVVLRYFKVVVLCIPWI